MKNTITCLFLLLSMSQAEQLIAQQKTRCGTVEYMARLKAEDPTLSDKIEMTESTAQRRGAAQQDEHDGCNPRREERVRDQPGPPEPERPGHDQHRARERSQHDAGPRKSLSPDVSV